MRRHLPDVGDREVTIRIVYNGVVETDGRTRTHNGAISVRCTVGTTIVTDSTVYGVGRDALARSIVDAFLNGDFDGAVLR